MSARQDPYASEAETLALLKPDVRSDAEKKLDAILESAGAWEQGVEAYPILYRIAVQLLDQTALRKPLHIGEETAAFKAWFDAWWLGDSEQGETIPTQSDKHFLTYLDQYTLGFGAWMAAKHATHSIKGDT